MLNIEKTVTGLQVEIEFDENITVDEIIENIKDLKKQ